MLILSIQIQNHKVQGYGSSEWHEWGCEFDLCMVPSKHGPQVLPTRALSLQAHISQLRLNDGAFCPSILSLIGAISISTIRKFFSSLPSYILPSLCWEFWFSLTTVVDSINSPCHHLWVEPTITIESSKSQVNTWSHHVSLTYLFSVAWARLVCVS